MRGLLIAIATMDGDLTDVNPAILHASADPAAWREARRAAILSRASGQLPTDPIAASGAAPLPVTVPTGSPATQADVLKQLAALKRGRREEDRPPPPTPPCQGGVAGASEHPRPTQPPAESPAPDASFLPANLREKLARAYAAAEAAKRS